VLVVLLVMLIVAMSLLMGQIQSLALLHLLVADGQSMKVLVQLVALVAVVAGQVKLVDPELRIKATLVALARSRTVVVVVVLVALVLLELSLVRPAELELRLALPVHP
jgi:hypothetical protein